MVSYKSAFNLEHPFHLARAYGEELRPRLWPHLRSWRGHQSLSEDAVVEAVEGTWRRGDCPPCGSTGGLGGLVYTWRA